MKRLELRAVAINPDRVRTIMEQNRQISLFSTPIEKGASEWSVFGGVREDRNTGMYRVQSQQASRYAVTTLKRPARPQSLFFKPSTQH